MCRWLSAEQLDSTLTEHLLSFNNPNCDWTLRHGRSAAIFVAMKESPSTIWTDQYELRLTKTLLALLSADRVPIVLNGVRACGYLLQHVTNDELELPQKIIVPFVRVCYICRCT